jgi:hypothetical protein
VLNPDFGKGRKVGIYSEQWPHPIERTDVKRYTILSRLPKGYLKSHGGSGIVVSSTAVTSS